MIYVLANANAVSGGPELLHQLCHKLTSFGYNSQMAYFNKIKFPSKRLSDNLIKSYGHYNCKITRKIEDIYGNSIILPETCLYFLPFFKKMRKVIWWMSVDNYYKTMNCAYAKLYAPLGMNRPKYNPFINDYLHCYQSEYARIFLLNKGIDEKNMLPLSDYLSKEFIKSADNEKSYKKTNNVLYNPRKGFETTEKIMRMDPLLNWIPLQGMTHTQMAKLMMESKVYIDFGDHPGKDRIPREAAICGCCVITGLRGSAKNAIDIPINEKYKYNDEQCELKAVLERIYDCLNNYKENREEFDVYRNCILNEESVFDKEVKVLGEMLEE